MYRRIGILTILTLFCLGAFFLSGQASQQGEGKKIALITPVTHPSLLKIEEGFRAQMKGYTIETFNAEGNPLVMKRAIEKIEKGHYDLVFTIGAVATQMTYEDFSKKGKTIPIVFGAVAHPELLKIDPAKYPITGSIEVVDFQQEIESLLEEHPNIRELLVIYDPTHFGFSEDIEKIKAVAKQFRIHLRTVEVFEAHEILTKSTAAIKESDAVLLLKDNTVIPAISSVLKLCEKYHVPVITSDLDSFDKGAMYSFGVFEKDYGTASGELALKILENHEKVSHLSYKLVKDFHFLKAKERQ